MSSWISRVTGSLRTSPPTSASPSSNSVADDPSTMASASHPRQAAHTQHRHSRSAGGSSVPSTHAARSGRNRSSQSSRNQRGDAAQPQPFAPLPICPALAHPLVQMGSWSTPAIPDSQFFAENFMIGVGMLIIQPATGKVVVINDPREADYWFFPKGRKDEGEDLVAAALREAYEESGYRATLMPLHTGSNAPGPPNIGRSYYNTEPFYVTTYFWNRRSQPPGIYITFWFVGEIPEDAEHHTGTGMPDEQHYQSHLLDPDTALSKVASYWTDVLRIGYRLFLEKVRDQQSISTTPPASA